MAEEHGGGPPQGPVADPVDRRRSLPRQHGAARRDGPPREPVGDEPRRRHRPRGRRVLAWVGGVLAALVLVVLLLAAVLQGDTLHGPIERWANERYAEHEIRIGGLDLRLLSRTPRLTVTNVTISNPPWMGGGTLAAVEHAVVEIRLLPLLVGRLIVERLEIDRPRADLYVAPDGRANFAALLEREDPEAAPDLPAIRRFLVREGRVRAVSEPHELELDARLEAAERATDDEPFPFRIAADGTLNREPLALRVQGAPLVNVAEDEPYEAHATVRAGETTLEAAVRVLEPFDLGRLQARATVEGRDLADLYYLTGLPLPTSRRYRLELEIENDELLVRIPRLAGRVGDSDVAGEASLDLRGERPRLVASLASDRLDLGDLAAPLGLPLGEGDEDAPPRERLLSDEPLPAEGLRAIDAELRFVARRVEARRVPFREVRLGLQLERGLLTVDPVAFTLREGRIEGEARLDASGEAPEGRLDLRVAGVELGQMRLMKTLGDGPPPLAGQVHGRIRLEGRGVSAREFAANTSGGITFVMPQGRVNEAFAELTGINVARGLGLLLTDPDERIDVRCGIADFMVHDGTIEVRNVVFDTDTVVVTARGTVELPRETIDLEIRGEPKEPRFLRLRTPIEIGGTLLDPSVGVDEGRLLAQGGAAAVLGAVLAPLAAAFAFVDAGLEDDENCGALMAEAREQGTPTRVAEGEAPAED